VGADHGGGTSERSITTEANEIIKPIHHRMPVIIKAEDYDVWLDVEKTADFNLHTILMPCDSKLLKAYEVSLSVNNPKNNTAECIVPKGHIGTSPG
jgi:putative SOS response-associated peptidase YedK